MSVPIDSKIFIDNEKFLDFNMLRLSQLQSVLSLSEKYNRISFNVKDINAILRSYFGEKANPHNLSMTVIR